MISEEELSGNDTVNIVGTSLSTVHGRGLIKLSFVGKVVLSG